MGAYDAMLMLLRDGPQVDAGHNSSRQPLLIACKYAQIQAVAILLRWGANETIKDNNGRALESVIGRSIARLLVRIEPRILNACIGC